MAIKTYNDQNFVAIANAIRAKNGETTQYKPSEMAPAIMAIESGLELLPQDTVAGAIANFPDGSNNYPVVELIANIEPKQSGSGDPAPDNVRPISGYTELKVYKQGKNLASGDKIQDGVNRVILCDGVYLKQGNYNISLSTSGTVANFYMKNHYGGSWSNIGGYNKTSVTFTISSADYYDISYYVSTGVSASDISNILLEVGSSATAYEPYQAPEVKTISWESEAGTVYGGSLNVTTGVLTVTGLLITLPSEGWTYYTTGGKNTFNMIIDGAAYGEVGYCEKYKFQNVSYISAQPNKSFYFYKVTDAVTRISICDNDYSNASAFGEAVSGTKLVYTLKTPVTYQLTPTQVKTLLGVNNIYSDTGDVEVTYRADIDLYIAKKIAEGA